MPEGKDYLAGKRVYLRSLEDSDAEFFYSSTNGDPEGRRLTGTQRTFSRKEIEDYIRNSRTDESRAAFAIVKLEDDGIVGEVVLNEISRNNRSANFRIFVADRYVGRGYGSEATRLALDYGFGMLNLHRIELDVYTINERAIHVYEKAGFKREGTKRENWYFDHQYYDSVVMSILEDEYRKI